MRTLSIRSLSKPNPSNWPKTEAAPLQRLRTFLLRDLLPSLIMVIILSVFASLLGQKIDQAKSSRTDHAVDVSLHP
jgi:hypothetical protein